MAKELNEKTQYRFESRENVKEPPDLANASVCRLVFGAIFKNPPFYAKKQKEPEQDY